MNAFGFATIVAGGLAATFLGLAAPSQAAPAGPGNAQDTVNQLEDRGYEVRINKHGRPAPLDQSDIVSVRYDDEDDVVYVDVR